MVTWITPTGHDDPALWWTDETDAHDDDTGTQATCDLDAGDTSGRLELTHSGVDGDVIRLYLGRSATGIVVEEVEVEYGGSWYLLASGPSVTWDAWNEFGLDSRQTMTGMRITFTNTGDSSAYVYVYETDFGETPPGPGPFVKTLGEGTIKVTGEGTISIL